MLMEFRSIGVQEFRHLSRALQLSIINACHRFIPEGEKDYRQAVERSETPVR